MSEQNHELTKHLKEFDKAAENNEAAAVLELSLNILKIGKDNLEPDVLENVLIVRSFYLAITGNPEEALNLLISLSEHGKFKLDIFYLLCFIYNQTRKYEDAVYFGNKYMDLYRIHADTPSITDAGTKAHEVTNNLCTANINLSRMEDAKKIIEEGISIKSDYPLLYQNLAVIYTIQNNFDKTVETFERAIKVCPGDNELYRMYGVTLKERFFFKRGEEKLHRAVDLGSYEAWFDLGILYSAMTRWGKAEEALKKYIEYSGGSIEAVNLLNNLKKTPFYQKSEPTVSAALIVKNEEEMLGQCLESVIDIADEIVVVDTGSTDRTVEIAEKYGAKVFHHPWKDSFAEARNHSLRHASCDWIFVIDADEELERQDIVNMMNAKWNGDKYDAILFPVFSVLPGQLGGINQGKHYSPRMFKNRDDIYYDGIVHNVLVMPDKVSMAEIRMHHYGYDLRPDKMIEKFNRSLKLLLKQIEDSPDDAFARFNIAQMYLSRNHFDEAEKHALKVIDILTEDNITQQHIYLMALNQLVLIYNRKKDKRNAENHALKALEIDKDYIDPLIALGWLYFSQDRIEEAEDVLDRFLIAVEKHKKTLNAEFLILSKLGAEYEAYYLLGEIALKKKNIKSAKIFFEKTLTINPFFWIAIKGLGEISMQEKKYDEAVKYFEESLKLGYLNSEKYGKEGASIKEYKKTLVRFQEAIELQVKAENSNDSLQDSLDSIDKLLNE